MVRIWYEPGTNLVPSGGLTGRFMKHIYIADYRNIGREMRMPRIFHRKAKKTADLLHIPENMHKLEAMFGDFRDIFRIETNHIGPAKGKVLISEPFLCDYIFGRSVILLVDHTREGSMGLVLNKPLPMSLNDIVVGLDDAEDIPLYQGGPISMDTLFYLHTLEGIPSALPIARGFYLNGDFKDIKQYIVQGGSVKGKLRFFLGYSGWGSQQLSQEIKENTWMVGKESVSTLMDEGGSGTLWQHALGSLGEKYELWSHFPQIPSLN